jgi:hypothetical protein
LSFFLFVFFLFFLVFVLFCFLFKQLYLTNHSESDTCVYELVFSQWPIISPPKILAFLLESPCIT